MEKEKVKKLEEIRNKMIQKISVDLDSIKTAKNEWATLTNTKKIDVLAKGFFALLAKDMEE